MDSNERFWATIWVCFFVAASAAAIGCTWAWAFQREAAYAHGYEQRIVPTQTQVSNETVWVKRETPAGAEIQNKP